MATVGEKPLMRGFLKHRGKKHLLFMTLTTVTVASLFKVFFVDKRSERLKNFYASYDPEKDYIRMREAGVFNSAPPRGTDK